MQIELAFYKIIFICNYLKVAKLGKVGKGKCLRPVIVDYACIGGAAAAESWEKLAVASNTSTPLRSVPSPPRRKSGLASFSEPPQM